MIDRILTLFHQICAIPHGSYHEHALGDYLQNHLRILGLSPRQDPAGNVLCDLPPTAPLPRCGLQAHMDMVVAVAAGFNPEHDPVVPVCCGDILSSDGRSSLGADNGVGLCCLLALAEQRESFAHGPLRLIFTVREEVGLAGAGALLPEELLDLTYLVNTDGFLSDVAIVGSAGGQRETYTRPAERTPNPYDAALSLTLKGFPGGHSGFDIAKGRGNPIKLAVESLSSLTAEKIPFALAAFCGGLAHNAIPTEASVDIALPASALAQAQKIFAACSAGIGRRFSSTAPEAKLVVAIGPPPATVLSQDCAAGLLSLLCRLFDGVYSFDPICAGLPQTSANLGRVSESATGELTVLHFVRSSSPAEEEGLLTQNEQAARETGFSRSAAGYPCWPFDPDNPLLKQVQKAYRARRHTDLSPTVSHVGLEPSVFLSKNPALHLISIGAAIQNAHSITESVSLSSVEGLYQLLLDTLSALQ